MTTKASVFTKLENVNQDWNAFSTCFASFSLFFLETSVTLNEGHNEFKLKLRNERLRSADLEKGHAWKKAP